MKMFIYSLVIFLASSYLTSSYGQTECVTEIIKQGVHRNGAGNPCITIRPRSNWSSPVERIVFRIEPECTYPATIIVGTFGAGSQGFRGYLSCNESIGYEPREQEMFIGIGGQFYLDFQPPHWADFRYKYIVRAKSNILINNLKPEIGKLGPKIKKTIYSYGSCTNKSRIIVRRTGGNANGEIKVYEKSGVNTWSSSPIATVLLGKNDDKKIFVVQSGEDLKVVLKNKSFGKTLSYKMNVVTAD